GPSGREETELVVVVVEGQPDLLEIVLALHACGRLAHFLHGGQEQSDQHADDGNNHQQLDQREAAAPTGANRVDGATTSPPRQGGNNCFRCWKATVFRTVVERGEVSERRQGSKATSPG